MRTKEDYAILKDGLPCPVCGGRIRPVMFEEEEEVLDKHTHSYYRTGRKRRACSHMECPDCFHKEAVDGDFLAGEWYISHRAF